jgi:hypothetical protein
MCTDFESCFLFDFLFLHFESLIEVDGEVALLTCDVSCFDELLFFFFEPSGRMTERGVASVIFENKISCGGDLLLWTGEDLVGVDMLLLLLRFTEIEYLCEVGR